MFGTRAHSLAFLSLLTAVGCGDDTTSAEGSASSTSSTSGVDAGSSSDSTSAAVTGSTTLGSTSGAGSGSGSGSSTATGEPSSSSGAETSGTSDASTSEGTTSTTSTGETGDETGGVATVCEDGGALVLSWSLQVPGGVYPDDIPEDLTATCSFAPSMTAGEIPFTCDGVDFLVAIESTPMAVLPDEAQSVEVRIHRQVGPLGFPDFWVELGFADGQRVWLINSSVLAPNNNTVELPYDMALSDQDCGPYNIGNPIQPEDPCGEQMWLGLELDLDANLTVFHGAQADGTSGGTGVGFWVATARDYGVLPKFCDFSATFYSAMVVTDAE